MAAATATATDQIVVIDSIAVETIQVPIIGTAPIIIHAFSEKAKRIMLQAQQGKKAPTTVRNPQADYEAAFYHIKGGGYGFPVIGFKAATVSACRFYRGLTMTSLKQFLFMTGEPGTNGQQMARIEGEPRMREDVVTLNRSTADLRYRPEFPEWSTVLNVTYVTSALTRGSVLSLIDAGGMGVGVGEMSII